MICAYSPLCALLQVGQTERLQAKEFFESAAGKAFETTVANEAKAGGTVCVYVHHLDNYNINLCSVCVCRAWFWRGEWRCGRIDGGAEGVGTTGHRGGHHQGRNRHHRAKAEGADHHLSSSYTTTKLHTVCISFSYVTNQAGDFSFIGVASSSSINSSASAEEASSDK